MGKSRRHEQHIKKDRPHARVEVQPEPASPVTTAVIEEPGEPTRFRQQLHPGYWIALTIWAVAFVMLIVYEIIAALARG